MENKTVIPGNRLDKKEDKIDSNSSDSTEITPEERELLDNADEGNGEEDDEQLEEAQLDATDEDGDLLNERSSDISGKDLDVPGTELDDADEAIGEEDEENNDYSMEDQDN